tara:strand:+ start:967 stop:1371 length:405 start_codon:yes stop_codon:yes gene_type:complete
MKNREIESIQQTNNARLRHIGVVIFILIISAVLFFLWKMLKHEKKNKEIQSRFSQEILKNQEAERLRISKDLHDGLGQSLLLIKNKTALNKDNTTGELLDTALSTSYAQLPDHYILTVGKPRAYQSNRTFNRSK